jgi:hypothetical protein
LNDPNLNSKAEYGEAITIDLALRNFTQMSTGGVNAILRSNDPNIVITDSLAAFGHFQAFDTITVANAFAFSVNHFVPNNHYVQFTILTSDSLANSWSSGFYVMLYAPHISLETMILDDSQGGNGNSYPEPGENILLRIPVTNIGGADIDSILCTLQSSNPNFVTTGNPIITQLKNASADTIEFTLYLSHSLAIGDLANLTLTANAGPYSTSRVYRLMTGKMIEDFESASFTSFPWTHGGNTSWTITNAFPQQGVYAAKSGTIGDGQTTSLSIQMNVIEEDSIRFYFKVSSEDGYDMFEFSIDSIVMGNWSGEINWRYAAFNVMPGPRVFKWEYVKDYFVLEGSDCAWLDYIVFPVNDIKSGVNHPARNKNHELTVFPNPATDELNLRIPSLNNSSVLIEIYDRQGKQVFSEITGFYGGTEKIISLKSMRSGLYYLKVSGPEEIYVKPFVISN